MRLKSYSLQHLTSAGEQNREWRIFTEGRHAAIAKKLRNSGNRSGFS
jgi:hypothetical protein